MRAAYESVTDQWEIVQRNRGYRTDVVRRVHAERRREEAKIIAEAARQRREAVKRAAIERAEALRQQANGSPEREAAAKRAMGRAMRSKSIYHRMLSLACILFDKLPEEIEGQSRARTTVFARQFVAYWTMRRTTWSLSQIGRIMGDRDHTTILHASGAYISKRKAMKRTLRMAR